MDNLDMILYICFFVAAVIGALLVFHFLGLLYLKFREWRFLRKHYPYGVPWYWRI